MKQLNLELMGVREMDAREVKGVDGGLGTWFEILMAGRGVFYIDGVYTQEYLT